MTLVTQTRLSIPPPDARISGEFIREVLLILSLCSIGNLDLFSRRFNQGCCYEPFDIWIPPPASPNPRSFHLPIGIHKKVASRR